MNGPLPTGWLRNSLPSLAAAVGLTTPFHTIARLASSAADGSFILNSTVLSSTARYDATAP